MTIATELSTIKRDAERLKLLEQFYSIWKRERVEMTNDLRLELLAISKQLDGQDAQEEAAALCDVTILRGGVNQMTEGEL